MRESNHLPSRDSPVVVRPVDDDIVYRCACGWDGPESAITDWHVDERRNRVLRVCPDCETPCPDWGSLRPIAAVARIARGSLRAELVEAGAVSEDRDDPPSE